MLLRGILSGLGIAVVSLFLFWRSMLAQMPAPSAGTAIEVRVIGRFAISFFGGIGIALAIVAAAIFGGGYAIMTHVRHLAAR